MGLFSSNRYFKPGKGVEKDEPQKKAFFRFFELFFRKFWKYVLLNLIYVGVLLPFLFFLYSTAYDMMYYFFVSMGFTPEQVEQVLTPVLYLATLYYSALPPFVTNILLAASILAYGPCRAGITYVIRNFTQEQHAWISDVWDKAKENWKQGIFFGVLDMLIFFIAVFNLSYQPDTGMTMLLRVSKYLTVLALVLYSFMRKYIFLMVVTVRLKASAILKNSWLLMMIGIFRNTGTAIVNLLLWIVFYLLTLLVHPIIELLFLPFFMFAFTNFLSVFACYPMVQKYLVEPINQLSDNEREQMMKASESKREARKKKKEREKNQYYNS